MSVVIDIRGYGSNSRPVNVLGHTARSHALRLAVTAVNAEVASRVGSS
jgi:hypothetical protein